LLRVENRMRFKFTLANLLGTKRIIHYLGKRKHFDPLL
jgi:hypothetical protein